MSLSSPLASLVAGIPVPSTAQTMRPTLLAALMR